MGKEPPRSDLTLPFTRPFVVSDLPKSRETGFDEKASDSEARAVAAFLGIPGVARLRIKGEIIPRKSGFDVVAQVSARVTQHCVVTLEHVRTGIVETVERSFREEIGDPDEQEIELVGDASEDEELLGPVIDPGQIALETLALALPAYPRKEGAALGSSVFSAPGIEPLSDEAARPFAALAELRKRMGQED